MKESKLIEELAKSIAKHGDKEVELGRELIGVVEPDTKIINELVSDIEARALRIAQKNAQDVTHWQINRLIYSCVAQAFEERTQERENDKK